LPTIVAIAIQIAPTLTVCPIGFGTGIESASGWVSKSGMRGEY
jgi:hypothetical protein